MSEAPDLEPAVGVAVVEDRLLIADGLRALLARQPGLRVVEPGSAEATFTVVGKSDAAVDLSDSIVVRLDEVGTTAELVDILMGDAPLPPAEDDGVGRPVALTPRERAVFQAVGRGGSAKTIALELGISARTVERHKQAVTAKLGVATHAAAVARTHAPRTLRNAG